MATELAKREHIDMDNLNLNKVKITIKDNPFFPFPNPKLFFFLIFEKIDKVKFKLLINTSHNMHAVTAPTETIGVHIY